jgi:hypothetical protein
MPVDRPPVDAREQLKAGLGPSFVIADLNADGMPDAAAVDFVADQLIVRLRRADGTFGAAAAIATGRGPRAVATGDFNHDGAVDLALAEFLSGVVRVFDGRGDGRFEAGAVRPLAAGGEPPAPGAMPPTGAAAPDVATLTATAGDGQWLTAATMAREPLVLSVSDAGGRPASGVAVAYLRLLGAAELVDATVNSIALTRFTDDGGLAVADLRLPRVPDATVVLATRSADEVAAFRVLSTLPVEAVVQHVSVALAEARLAGPVRRDVGALLRQATRQLARGNAEAAIGDLVALVDRLDVVAAGGDIGSLAAAGLARRWLQQTLLLGASPQVPDNEPIVCDVAIVRTIATSAELDRFTLDAVAGELIHVTISGAVAAFTPVWRLIGPDSNPVAGCDTLSATTRECSLLLAGTHAIEVQDNGLDSTGTYTLHFQRLTTSQRCGVALVCDVAVVPTISAAADTDLHQLDGVAGERLHVTIAGAVGAFTPEWRLLGPDSSPAAECGTFTGTERECVLALSGAYAIEVQDGGFNAAGTYTLHFQRLTSSQRCSAALACDVAAVPTISSAADTDLHQFDGVAGERIHVTIAGAVGAFTPEWRLFGPDSNPAPGCGTFAGAERECVLTTAGAYAIEVQDSGFNAIGTYTLHFQRLTTSQRCGVALVCDIAVLPTISSAADTDLHQFDGAAGERIHVTIAGAVGAFTPVWRLLAPDGEPVAGCDTFVGTDRECVLAQAGAYAIEVEDGGFNSIGTYTLHFQRLMASERCGVALVCDVAVVPTISTGADTDLHQFGAVPGDLVHVTISGAVGAFGPVWRLVGPDALPAGGCGTFSGVARDCTLPLPTECLSFLPCVAGPRDYAIEVQDGGFDASGTYALQIQQLTAPRRCATIIACDGHTATISSGADTDLVQLTSYQGEVLHISLTGAVGAFNPEWRLIGPDSVPVAGCDTFSTAARDCGLTLNGFYGIEVQDTGFNAAGTYALSIAYSASICSPLGVVVDHSVPPWDALPGVPPAVPPGTVGSALGFRHGATP